MMDRRGPALLALTAVLACNANGRAGANVGDRPDSGAARADTGGASRDSGHSAEDGETSPADAASDTSPSDTGSAADAPDASQGPATLCIGGQLYTLADHDEFAQDGSLSVSDTWPPASGTRWSNRYQWGRTNNPGGDDSYYPSLADLASWGLPPVAQILPGVGLAVDSYPVTTPTPSAEETTLCADGTCRGHLSGLLSNTNVYTSGYWVYSAQLPSGNGWWPAVWELNETTMGCYDELDNLEQWSPDVFGAGSVSQTEQLSSGACAVDGGTALGHKTIVATSDSAFHTYGALATSTYVGFYIDAMATTKQLPRYAVTPLNPIIQVQVCIASWCQPYAGPTDTARMIVQYYRYYAPPPTPTSCPAPYDLPGLLP